MSFEMTIRANDASEFAQQAVALAFMLSPGLKDRLLAGAAPAAEPENEPAEDVKRGRGRPKKSAVAENVAKKETEATDDVRTTGSSGAGDAAGAVGGTDSAGAAGGDEQSSAAEAGQAEEAEASDAVRESEAAPDEPVMSIDDLRKFTIDQYLNVATADLAVRKDLYKALLTEFAVDKISELPADKINAFKASVDAKIVAAAKGGK